MNHSNPPYSHEQERLRMLQQQLRSQINDRRNKITIESIKKYPRQPKESLANWVYRITFQDGEI